MAGSPSATVDVMTAVPPKLRGSIVSGMRWTLWLSVLAVPFSYGTSVVFARMGPEVVGTYGLLILYLGLVSSVLYLGGDAVVIKFVPELAVEKRVAFLGSYFLVITVALAPWLAAATLWPDKLHYLFGGRGGAPFELLILFLSPVYILFSLVVAALKATLEIGFAQMLFRMLTIGSFLFYAALFFGARPWLATHYPGLIWGVYLGLTVLAIGFGLLHLLRLNHWRCDWRALCFFLPRGFWSYTLSTQQVSTVWFFIQRLDIILVLNFGGLALLGKYVTIVTLAESIRAGNRLFVDTLLPSLTNVLASGNLAGASQVFSTNLRTLFVVDIAASSALMFFVGPITHLLGAEYVPLAPLFVVMLLLTSLAAPGTIGGVLLSSVGKQQRAVWVGLGQLGLFTILFSTLWPRWHLWGAVLASGMSMLFCQVLLLVVAKHSVQVKFSAGKDYAKFMLVGVMAAVLALPLIPLNPLLAIPAWSGVVGLFLMIARYRLTECLGLLYCFLPRRWIRLEASGECPSGME